MDKDVRIGVELAASGNAASQVNQLTSSLGQAAAAQAQLLAQRAPSSPLPG